MKLTEKQKRFADFYIETGNASESYKRAYDCNSDKTASVEGSRNLAKPSVKKYIDERMKLINSETIANQQEIMEYLTAVMRGEVTEEIPVPTKKGIAMIEAKVGVKDRTKAAELIGKRYKMWIEKKEIEGSLSPVVIVRGDPNGKRN